MNLEITAKGQLTNEATGKKTNCKYYFSVIQVPTSKTFEIIESKDPVNSYKEYIFEYLDNLAEWEKTMKDLGLTITFSYD